MASSLSEIFGVPFISILKPMTKNSISVIAKVGTVVIAIYLMCLNSSAPAIAGDKFVVSLRGDILSPK